jgi:hypothetical protein
MCLCRDGISRSLCGTRCPVLVCPVTTPRDFVAAPAVLRGSIGCFGVVWFYVIGQGKPCPYVISCIQRHNLRHFCTGDEVGVNPRSFGATPLSGGSMGCFNWCFGVQTPFRPLRVSLPLIRGKHYWCFSSVCSHCVALPVRGGARRAEGLCITWCIIRHSRGYNPLF